MDLWIVNFFWLEQKSKFEIAPISFYIGHFYIILNINEIRKKYEWVGLSFALKQL